MFARSAFNEMCSTDGAGIPYRLWLIGQIAQVECSDSITGSTVNTIALVDRIIEFLDEDQS